MKIAVTYENENVFQHFGHTENFKIYTTEGGNIISSEVVPTNGSGHGALAGFLSDICVNVVICGGIGGGAQNALKSAQIELFGGVSGRCDDAVRAYLDGKLNFNPNVKCDHHDHEHGDNHTCSAHGCVSHKCGHHE